MPFDTISPSAPASVAATPNTDDGPQNTRIRSFTRFSVLWKFSQSLLLSLMPTTLSRSASRSAMAGVIAFPALPGMLYRRIGSAALARETAAAARHWLATNLPG